MSYMNLLSAILQGTTKNRNDEGNEMRMMDIREKILAELDRKPGDTFSASAIARAIGATPKSTTATLGRLFKAGLVARLQKGVYSSKGRPPETTPAPKPAKPRKSQKPAKATEPVPAPVTPLSVITIDLLVEGEQSKIDASGFLGKVRENRSVLDARVRKITAADQTKLKIRFSFPDED
jgi:hypothetical protein